MGKPHCLKTENDPIFTSSSFDKFCNQWNIILTHGIPHNPTLVERAHHTLKMCLLKEKTKREHSLAHVSNALNIALFTTSALNVQYEDNAHCWSSILDMNFSPKEPLPKI